MLPPEFSLLAAAISLFAGSRYIISTLQGKTQPNRVTWFLLTLFTTPVFFAALLGDVQWQTLVGIGAPYFNVAAIFAVSFVNPKAYWKSEPRDYYLGALALLGFVLWLATDTPEIAVALAIAADFLAALPTLIKSFKHPSSEKISSFVLWTISSCLLVLAIQEWKFVAYAFPVYLVFFNGSMALSGWRGGKINATQASNN